MANTKGGGAAYCPFYVKEAGQSLTCEGLLPGTLTAMKFKNACARQAYQEKACFSRECEELCPLAALLMSFYDECGNRKPLRVETLRATAKRPAKDRETKAWQGGASNGQGGASNGQGGASNGQGDASKA